MMEELHLLKESKPIKESILAQRIYVQTPNLNKNIHVNSASMDQNVYMGPVILDKSSQVGRFSLVQ
jgi:hypothetical protein